MKNITLTCFLFILTVIFSISFTSCKNDKGVKIDTTPTELYEKMINNPAFKENPNGEGFCFKNSNIWNRFGSHLEVICPSKSERDI